MFDMMVNYLFFIHFVTNLNFKNSFLCELYTLNMTFYIWICTKIKLRECALICGWTFKPKLLCYTFISKILLIYGWVVMLSWCNFLLPSTLISFLKLICLLLTARSNFPTFCLGLLGVRTDGGRSGGVEG